MEQTQIKIKIYCEPGAKYPLCATKGSVAYDVYCHLTEEKIKKLKHGSNRVIKLSDTKVLVSPNERVVIPTGIYMEIPYGYEAQIRPRSGHAIKSGLTVLNTPGTIDSDYRGEIGVILYNTGDKSVEIENGDKIAQMVINEVVMPSSDVDLRIVENYNDLSQTDRGKGGFGSTGNK